MTPPFVNNYRRQSLTSALAKVLKAHIRRKSKVRPGTLPLQCVCVSLTSNRSLHCAVQAIREAIISKKKGSSPPAAALQGYPSLHFMEEIVEEQVEGGVLATQFPNITRDEVLTVWNDVEVMVVKEDFRIKFRIGGQPPRRGGRSGSSKAGEFWLFKFFRRIWPGATSAAAEDDDAGASPQTLNAKPSFTPSLPLAAAGGIGNMFWWEEFDPRTSSGKKNWSNGDVGGCEEEASADVDGSSDCDDEEDSFAAKPATRPKMYAQTGLAYAPGTAYK